MISSTSNESTPAGTFAGYLRAYFAVIVVVFSACGQAAQAQHSADLWLGARFGRIVWQTDGGLDPASTYLPLLPVDNFLLHGWSNNDPGFDHVPSSSGGIAPLPPGVEIWLELVSRDPAFYAVGSAAEVLEFPDDATFLGEEDVHAHITWLVDREDGQFDEDQCVWQATFRLFDERGVLGDSVPLTMLFTNVAVRAVGVSATGDFDDDQDVDGHDMEGLAVCVNGPDVRSDPNDPVIATCEVDCFNAFDFDDDLDIDLRDYAGFQNGFGN